MFWKESKGFQTFNYDGVKLLWKGPFHKLFHMCVNRCFVFKQYACLNNMLSVAP